MERREREWTWDELEQLRPRVRRRLARRCRDESELDDLVQETLMRAARYRGSLADPGRLGSWVASIAGNVFHDHLQREGRLPRVEGAEATLHQLEGREPAPSESEADPDVVVAGEAWERDSVVDAMRSSFACLRPDDRVVLADYYGGEMSCKETARRTGIAPELVKVRLFRARKRLRSAVTASLGHRSGVR
ncbi:MAG: sigma-70 family RNA polymerase sigma factor [Planctomycetota bacterium]|nr:sigma-70 family RNA polymerase sigma factor [Planctomycetota bacterium]MDP6761335.1 sigma-70 family RNA polymerase sigma factor [Planctomycetota bacterium]MDP6991046.1 sigma-70 family RNA polymerase sigma factor [Planctomycetota bacterium]